MNDQITDYHIWKNRHDNDMETWFNSLRALTGDYHPVCYGRFLSFLPDRMDGQVSHWIFREHAIPVNEALNMCPHCIDYQWSPGGREEPPDAWCERNFAKQGGCRMRSHLIHVARMMGLDPDDYPSEEW